MSDDIWKMPETIYFNDMGEQFGTVANMMEELSDLRMKCRKLIDKVKTFEETAKLAEEFRFWFNEDGSPCDGFRFRHIGQLLDDALRTSGYEPRNAYGIPPK